MYRLLIVWLWLCPAVGLYAQNRKPLPAYSATYRQIDSLITQKAFFTARLAYEKALPYLDKSERLLLGATLDNFFNRLSESNDQIRQLEQDHSSKLTDSMRLALLLLQQFNCSRLGDYARAYAATRTALQRYKSLMTKSEYTENLNNQKIWRACRTVSPQAVTISRDVTIAMRRDKIGLANLSVTKDTSVLDFIFDTGANISTVSESTARRLNMQWLNGTVEVGAITGKKVKARLAVCDRMHIADIVIENALFLVFPDKALYIAPLSFQINGIIGFPVINALKEIHFRKKDTLFIPTATTPMPIQNMALDFLTPVIGIDEESYTFDTGADNTMLYKAFYQKYKTRIDSAYTERPLSFAGVGGGITKPGYKVNFTKTLFGKRIQLDSISLYKSDFEADAKKYYGNIGQDLIRQFDEFILNFESMYILFKDR
jgi:predicted aspartyl protease